MKRARMSSIPFPRRTGLALAVLLAAGTGGLCPTPTSAQEDPVVRARQALPADVYERLTRLAGEANGRGIPPHLLFEKALEGNAKGVPPGRLLPGVEAYASRLDVAREAFGPNAQPPLLKAGADALQRGVDRASLRELARSQQRSPMAVLVLADLMEDGVQRDRALQLLRDAMAGRARDDEMLDIPARLRRLVREGRTPDEAVEHLRRLLRQRRAGVGPPVPPGSEPTTRERRRGG